MSSWIESGRAAIDVLEGTAFAETIAETVLAARWRALTSPDVAELELVDEFERAVSDLEFVPRIEASLPRGFPAPTPVREIELKSYPAYRMARTNSSGSASNSAFWKLFQHIESQEIAMTAPVEMTYREDAGALEEVRMAFLYGDAEIGQPGDSNNVEVVDVPEAWAVSLGCRGTSSRAAIAKATERLRNWMGEQTGLEIAGELRVLSYNSPMVRSSQRYFEVQFPVRSKAISPRGQVVLDFGASDAADRWGVINDGVMGGLSTSRFQSSGEGSCVFSGSVSMENNGGFASVRTRPDSFGLKGSKAISLKFRGDGKTYKLNLRTDDSFDGASYRVGFETVAGVWMTRVFEYSEFEPVWRGRPVRDAGPLDPERVRTIGLMISDKQAGSFRLEVANLMQE